MASKRFSFGFAPDCSGEFCGWNRSTEDEPYLQNLSAEASELATAWGSWPSGVSSSSILAEFPALFSSALGKADCAPYKRII